MNNIEKLAIAKEIWSENFIEKWGMSEQLIIFAEVIIAKALQQSSEPVADYTPNKDCTMCNGGGLYCVGYSGSESDGNAPILERCECYLDSITAPASVSLEKYNKLLDALNSPYAHIEIDATKETITVVDKPSHITVEVFTKHQIAQALKAIAEAEGK